MKEISDETNLFSMKRILLFVILVAIVHSINAQQSFELPVWSNGAPNSNGILKEENYNEKVKGFQYVTTAKMYVYLPENTTASSAVVLCPGGGYATVNICECQQFAKWIVSKGMAAIVLKYRIPNGHPEVPISDVKEALTIIHKNAKQWRINSSKIGIAGFSAGGHLASFAATHFHDSITKPAFAMQFFSVINANENFAHTPSIKNLIGENTSKELLDLYSNDVHVSSSTPTTIIFCATYDPIVDSQNSIEYCLMLKKKNVPVAMYLLPIKVHGELMEESNPFETVWKDLLKRWMISEKLI